MAEIKVSRISFFIDFQQVFPYPFAGIPSGPSQFLRLMTLDDDLSQHTESDGSCHRANRREIFFVGSSPSHRPPLVDGQNCQTPIASNLQRRSTLASDDSTVYVGRTFHQ